MSCVRRISAADAVDAGYPGYQVVMAASPESATVLAGFLGNGGHPPLHTHEVDLFFVVLEGSTSLGYDAVLPAERAIASTRLAVAFDYPL